MPLAIAAFLDLRPAMLGWIEGVRQVHLPAPDITLAPHVTLVFPTDVKNETEITSHLVAAASSCAPIAAAFRIAAPVADPPRGDWTVQLFPDEGLSRLVRLHDLLHTGPLADQLNLDIPYIPHITVARKATGRQAKALAEDLNAGLIDVAAPVRSIDLVRVNDAGATRVASYRLTG